MNKQNDYKDWRNFTFLFIIIFFGTLLFLTLRPVSQRKNIGTERGTIMTFEEKKSKYIWSLNSVEEICRMYDPNSGHNESFQLRACPISELKKNGYYFSTEVVVDDVFVIGPVDELGTYAIIAQDREGFAIFLNDTEDKDFFMKMDKLTLTGTDKISEIKLNNKNQITSKYKVFKEKGYDRLWNLNLNTLTCEMIDNKYELKQEFKCSIVSLSKLIRDGLKFSNNIINHQDVYLIGPIDELGTYAIIAQDKDGFAIYLNDTGNNSYFNKMDNVTLQE